VVCVYDVGNRKSYEDLETWVQWLKSHKTDDNMFCFVGNKIDIPDSERKVTETEIKEFADK